MSADLKPKKCSAIRIVYSMDDKDPKHCPLVFKNYLKGQEEQHTYTKPRFESYRVAMARTGQEDLKNMPNFIRTFMEYSAT
ncbi:hypothetical protein Trydic_g3790 [Trypoxylus dichotomus]